MHEALQFAIFIVLVFLICAICLIAENRKYERDRERARKIMEEDREWLANSPYAPKSNVDITSRGAYMWQTEESIAAEEAAKRQHDKMVNKWNKGRPDCADIAREMRREKALAKHKRVRVVNHI
jgi:hypothetical protein